MSTLASHLIELDMSFTSVAGRTFGGNIVPPLFLIDKFKQLKKLNINRCGLEKHSFANLAQSELASRLTLLGIGNSNIQVKDIRKNLDNFKALENLVMPFAGCSEIEVWAKELAKSAIAHQLRIINIGRRQDNAKEIFTNYFPNAKIECSETFTD